MTKPMTPDAATPPAKRNKIIDGLQEAIEQVRGDDGARPQMSPVSQAAADALQAADGDVRKATEAMLAAVRKSRRLRDALTEPLLETACYAAITAQCRKQRSRIWTPPNYSEAGNGDRVIALARTLLDFPLPGGRRLGDATRAEVVDAARFYTSHAEDMAHKARWLARVAEAVPDGQRVADALDEARLARLQEDSRDA